MSFYTYLEKEHNYTSYQIRLVHYVITALLSEFSKFMIMGLFFHFLSLLPEFIFCIVIFSFLRRYSGGLHCSSYLSCLLLTFFYLFCCIVILPPCSFSKFTMLLMLTVSIAVIYRIAPVPSHCHAELSAKQCQRYKTVLSGFCFLYFIALFILPVNHFLSCGFWVIIIHSIQLLAAYMKEVILCHFSNEI